MGWPEKPLQTVNHTAKGVSWHPILQCGFPQYNCTILYNGSKSSVDLGKDQFLERDIYGTFRDTDPFFIWCNFPTLSQPQNGGRETCSTATPPPCSIILWMFIQKGNINIIQLLQKTRSLFSACLWFNTCVITKGSTLPFRGLFHLQTGRSSDPGWP
jgi:hypothetical protein